MPGSLENASLAFAVGALGGVLGLIFVDRSPPVELLERGALATLCFAVGCVSALKRPPSARKPSDALQFECPSQELPETPRAQRPARAAKLAARAESHLARLQDKLAQVRRQLHPATVPEYVAARYIVGNKGDVGRAASQLREYVAWRERERVDAVASDPPLSRKQEDALQRHYDPKVLPGLDLSGRPVMYIDVGGIDMQALRSQGVTLAHVARRYVRSMEHLQAVVDGSPNPFAGHVSAPQAATRPEHKGPKRAHAPCTWTPTQPCPACTPPRDAVRPACSLPLQLLILDLHGCSISKFLRATQMWREVNRIGQAFYPELLGHLLMVRGPPAAAWAVAQAKRWLDPETRAKLELSSGNPRIALSRLLGESPGVALPKCLEAY